MNILKNFKLKEIEFKNFIFLNRSEKEMVLKWRNHPNVRNNMFNNYIISKNEHFKFITKLVTNKNNFYWLVKDPLDSLGVFYLNNVDIFNKRAYLGIYTNPIKIQNGRGAEIIKSGMELFFKKINFHTLKLEVFEKNKVAFNFYKKIGFEREGILRDYIIRNDKWLNVLILGIIKNEWSKLYE
ncbi:MAG: UDP-4-amino-4,6-dideoxy-N-acetyl-beta-L-altrosamine N-acetyltransferase [Candidatus Cloacimonetes bacterium]|nr:UDP-4-amino-4,6-dideoxy-N-acetyl-beta-L-altrosamine N-acetyltransferase [Candidatus Cloacimonadota bacterium]